MSKPRSWRAGAKWLPWLAAVAAGGTAATLASRYIAGRIATAEAALVGQYAMRSVIVAGRELAEGHTIRHEDLALRQWPARFAPSGARSAEAALDLIGRITLHPLAPGDPVVQSGLESSDRPSLASLVGSNRRAITLAVDEINGFAGLLSPGDVIDLVYIADSNATRAGATTVRPLLEGVSVIATGRSTRRVRATEGDGVTHDVDVDYATVALDVAPVDAERLVLAQRAGEVTALLRGTDPASAAALRIVDISAIDGSGPPLARPRRNAGVQIIVGGAGARTARALLATLPGAAP